MKTLIQNLIEGLRPTSRNRDAMALAIQVEASARTLSGLDAIRPKDAPSDLVSILGSARLLLDRLVESDLVSQPPERQAHSAEPEPAPPAVQSHESRPDAVEERPADSVAEGEPSPAVNELIKLRDWVLMAQSAGGDISPQMLGNVYRKLGQILDREEVCTLEDAGPFDPDRQMAVDTLPTDDPELVDTVSSTVRPGYQFSGKLIRPQEVVVYVRDYGVGASAE